jgi:hypothetical protein
VPLIELVRRSRPVVLVPTEELKENRVNRGLVRNRLTPCHDGVILLLGDLLVRPQIVLLFPDLDVPRAGLGSEERFGFPDDWLLLPA